MSEFSIDPDTINKYVAEKIVESGIGEALKKAIDDEIARISKSYDNPMKQVVAIALSEATREYLETPEIKSRLRGIVEERLTDDVLEKFISSISLTRY